MSTHRNSSDNAHATAEQGRKKRPGRRLLGAAGAGLAVLAVLGVGAFALAGGFDKTVSERVSGSGTQVVRVALVDAAVGFDVTPDELEVVRGTHVVLEVVNEGDEEHDLLVDGGPQTRTLDPGQSERLDLGVVISDRPSWCTLSGHKLAGMRLDIRVVDRSTFSSVGA